MESIKKEYYSGLKTKGKKILLTLRLISNIPSDGQLDTSSGEVTIFQWSPWNVIYRSLIGDGREHTVNALQGIYEDIEIFLGEFIEAMRTESDSEGKELLVSFAERMNESIQGIRNLRLKYKEDHTIAVRLHHIEADMIIPRLNNMIATFPVATRPLSIAKQIRDKSMEELIKDVASAKDVEAKLPNINIPLRRSSAVDNVCANTSPSLSDSLIFPGDSPPPLIMDDGEEFIKFNPRDFSGAHLLSPPDMPPPDMPPPDMPPPDMPPPDMPQPDMPQPVDMVDPSDSDPSNLPPEPSSSTRPPFRKNSRGNGGSVRGRRKS